MTSTKKCEFCDKRGLPLLLVRDAVAPAESGAPTASSLPIPLPSSAAHYTKRLLRSGYVNVFDEARRRWEAYFVTPDGYFFKLLQTPGMAPVVPMKPFNCPDEGHRAVASCISIPDPLNASKVWIGFSDVLWTEEIRKKNEDATYRSRHMTEIDVKAVLSGRHEPHHPIARLSDVVAEYSMTITNGGIAFGGSPFVFNSRQGRAERVQKECEAMRPGKALIVTVPDPAGLVQEIAFLMKHNVELFFKKRPEDRRKAAASAAIDQIKVGVHVGVEDAEISGAEEIANQRIQDDPLGHWFSKATREKTEKIRNVDSAELKRVSRLEWAKYEKKFNDPQRTAWLTYFKSQFSAFDKTNIAPLAEAHVSWMRSESLAAYFECNYDQRDSDAGKVYTTILTHCVLATQDKAACANLYEEWLKGNIDDPNNLLLRGLVVNQLVNINAIKNAVSASVDIRQIPWDNIFGVNEAAKRVLDENSQNIAAKLFLELSGPIARGFGRILDGSKDFRALVMASGFVSGYPVTICEVTGSRKLFVERLVRHLVQANSNQIEIPDMKRAVKAELRRLEVHGARLDGDAKKKWIVVADKNLIKNMPTGLSPEQQAKWMAKSITTISALDNTNLERWRSVVNRNAPKVVVGVIQLVCLTKLVADEEKSLSNENFDASRRLYAGIVSLVATSFDAVGGFAASRAALGLRFGQGVVARSGVFLQAIGKIGGVCAGMAMALLDARKARDAVVEKQMGLAWLYTGSAFIGFGLTIFLAFPSILVGAAVPVIGTLIVLAIVIGIIIDREKDNPVQDWLERCPWGVLEGQRYADIETEQAELAKALE